MFDWIFPALQEKNLFWNNVWSRESILLDEKFLLASNASLHVISLLLLRWFVKNAGISKWFSKVIYIYIYIYTYMHKKTM